MTHDADNPDHIEREIEKDRDALRRTLNDLQDELSLDGLSRRLTGSVRRNGAEWAEWPRSRPWQPCCLGPDRISGWHG